MDETPRANPTLVVIHPRIRARLQTVCEHQTVIIDATLAELECENCGKEINPYWWIHGLCEDWQAYTAELQAHEAKIRAHQEEVTEKYRGWIAHMNARIRQLEADVATLQAKKAQLMKEEVRGLPLGAQVKRWRRT